MELRFLSLRSAGRGTAIFAVFLAGCASKPRQVDVIDIDADDAATQAIEAYDTNHDGELTDDELRAVPGILKWKQRYDADSNGSVSEAEIVQRLEKWQTDRLGFLSMSANVHLDGRPVSGATVTLMPEPYLGDAVKPASGITDANGNAVLSVKADDLPEAIKARGLRIGGVYPGTYKITIAKAGQKLPDAGADGLPLGEEISQDTVQTHVEVSLTAR